MIRRGWERWWRPLTISPAGAWISALAWPRPRMSLTIWASISKPAASAPTRCWGALQALWTQPVPEFQGEFYQYSGLKFSPKPLQTPYPPILVGGSSPAAMRRIVRYGDGWHTLRQSPDEVAAGLAKLKSMMAEAGRDPEELKISISIELVFDASSPSRPPGERRGLRGSDEDVAETLRAFRDARRAGGGDLHRQHRRRRARGCADAGDDEGCAGYLNFRRSVQ